jgi:hypothetical protein
MNRLERRIAALQAFSDGLIVAVIATFIPLTIIAFVQAGTP